MINVGICGLGFMGMIHYLAYQKVRGAKVRRSARRFPSDWPAIGGRSGQLGPRGKKMNLAESPPTASWKMLADPNIDMVDIACRPAHAEMASPG